MCPVCLLHVGPLADATTPTFPPQPGRVRQQTGTLVKTFCRKSMTDRRSGQKIEWFRARLNSFNFLPSSLLFSVASALALAAKLHPELKRSKMLRMKLRRSGRELHRRSSGPRRPCGTGLGPGPGRVQACAERVLAELDEQLGGVGEAAPCRRRWCEGGF